MQNTSPTPMILMNPIVWAGQAENMINTNVIGSQPNQLNYYIDHKTSFNNTIINRGIDYHHDGLVGELYNLNRSIYSKVNGYVTMIAPNQMYCSCPCTFNCKHMYALLLEIEELGIPTDLFVSLHRMGPQQLIGFIEKIIDQKSVETIEYLQMLTETEDTDTDMSSDTDSDTDSDTNTD